MPTKRASATQQGLVVFAKNKKRVSAYCQQTLGLKIEESETTQDLLRGHGNEVVIHTIPRKYAATIKIARLPEPREDAFGGGGIGTEAFVNGNSVGTLKSNTFAHPVLESGEIQVFLRRSGIGLNSGDTGILKLAPVFGTLTMQSCSPNAPVQRI